MYHGGVSRSFIAEIREACPSIYHGYGFSPQKLVDYGEPYFLDNGAFTDKFDPEEWREMLRKADGFERKPDFVVLPDKFNDPEETLERSRNWVDVPQRHGYDYYFVAQKPAEADSVVRHAQELDAAGVFIGGDWDWKSMISRSIVEKAHRRGLKVHIGMPTDYYWAYNTGPDSMDSVTIVRNQDLAKARDLERSVRCQENFRTLETMERRPKTMEDEN